MLLHWFRLSVELVTRGRKCLISGGICLILVGLIPFANHIDTSFSSENCFPWFNVYLCVIMPRSWQVCVCGNQTNTSDTGCITAWCAKSMKSNPTECIPFTNVAVLPLARLDRTIQEIYPKEQVEKKNSSNSKVKDKKKSFNRMVRDAKESRGNSGHASA